MRREKRPCGWCGKVRTKGVMSTLTDKERERWDYVEHHRQRDKDCRFLLAIIRRLAARVCELEKFMRRIHHTVQTTVPYTPPEGQGKLWMLVDEDCHRALAAPRVEGEK